MPLKVSDGIGAWIKDFQKSDAPQFKGHSSEKRREQAIAAYLSAKRGPQNESTNIEENPLLLYRVGKVASKINPSTIGGAAAAGADMVKKGYTKVKKMFKKDDKKEAMVYVGKMTGKGFQHAEKPKMKKDKDTKLPPHLKDLATIRKAFAKTKAESIGRTPGDDSYHLLQKAKRMAAKDGHDWDKLPQYHRGKGVPHKDYYHDKAKTTNEQFHLFSNEDDARKKAKEIGGKYVKGTGASSGKHVAMIPRKSTKKFSGTADQIKKQMKTHKQKHDKIGIGEKVGVMKSTAGQTRRMKSATRKGDVDTANKAAAQIAQTQTGNDMLAQTRRRMAQQAAQAKKPSMIMKKKKRKGLMMGEAMTTGNEPGMMFKVSIDGLPDMIMVGRSPSDIKQQLRKIVKQPSMITGVSRMPKSQVRKMYRDLAGGKNIEENYLNDYGTPESVKRMKGITPGQSEAMSSVDKAMKHLKNKEKLFPGSTYINFKNPYAKIEKGKTKKQMGKNDNAED